MRPSSLLHNLLRSYGRAPHMQFKLRQACCSLAVKTPSIWSLYDLHMGEVLRKDLANGRHYKDKALPKPSHQTKGEDVKDMSRMNGGMLYLPEVGHYWKTVQWCSHLRRKKTQELRHRGWKIIWVHSEFKHCQFWLSGETLCWERVKVMYN